MLLVHKILRDRDYSIIFVSLDTYIKIGSILQKLGVGYTKETQLVQGITCIAVDRIKPRPLEYK